MRFGEDSYSPQTRNHVPWIIIGICYVICPILLIILRVMLRKENEKRDLEPPDETFDDVWLKQTDEDGNQVERRVDKVCLKYVLSLDGL